MLAYAIPAQYRQLTRDQILAGWVGQQRPRCHVELIRLFEPQPQTVFAVKPHSICSGATTRLVGAHASSDHMSRGVWLFFPCVIPPTGLNIARSTA